MKWILVLLMMSWRVCFVAQSVGIIEGRVVDKNTEASIIGASVLVPGTDPMVGTATDENGKFILSLPVGTYQIQVTYTGYLTQTIFHNEVSSGNVNVVKIEMEEDVKLLDEIELSANRSIQVGSLESPNSLQRLSAQEIKSSPGGNFDVFKVIQSLPGIASVPGVGNRNDVIIRGGSPSENVYYLDGIEIPVINHFTTQGSAGGSNGIINVAFVNELTLHSSAFDARYDNALSSIFQFKQKSGNSTRLQTNFRLSSSEFAATAEGPLSKNTSFLGSVRRSYLQYLFQALNLAIRPNYWDFQTKVQHRFSSKTTLTLIGLGALDNFFVDAGAEKDVTNAYILKRAPFIDQWNYTVGLNLKHIFSRSVLDVALSRNTLNNQFEQYEDADKNDPNKRNISTFSQEAENKLKVNLSQQLTGWTIHYGGHFQWVTYSNNFESILKREIRDSSGQVLQSELKYMFQTNIDFAKYGVHVQASRSFLQNSLGLSVGIRSDADQFTGPTLLHWVDHISPRVSLSFTWNNHWKTTASVGRYVKLPAYTILGYKNNNGEYVNSDASYIKCVHYSMGTEFLPRASTRITAEVFLKRYWDYPLSQRTGINLANTGSEFGYIGNEDINSNGKGRAYGFEFFVQQKLVKSFFALGSYSYILSDFSGEDGSLIPSSWDNRHLFSITLGKKFKKSWELGLKYRFAGGTPYTPFDEAASRLNYLSSGVGVLDYEKLNTKRLSSFHQVDFRINKKWNMKKWSIEAFYDMTNALLFKNQDVPDYVFERTEDNSGFKTSDGQPIKPDGSNAIPKILSEAQASFIPSLGFVLEF
ncbi:MAG: TonB-dependent receptor [Saprospiraceae bacterium]|nr:TonB-dependent receptor [Saprospiraceae bacterium]MBK7797042.1 TonB-dependent receptor [Saprospiraceae bacterium]MBK8152146.1 TonB-dependent receptor [Saprospiraceae bacterium]MBL0259565.1 TonB-dependent receptor [Saprospiraceae bacterium]